MEVPFVVWDHEDCILQGCILERLQSARPGSTQLSALERPALDPVLLSLTLPGHCTREFPAAEFMLSHLLTCVSSHVETLCTSM